MTALAKQPDRSVIGLMATFLAFLLLWSGPAAADGPVIGAAAPAFTGETSSGDVISLSDFDGQRVVLEWTNHECPFVRKHYESGNMQALQKAAAEDGVVWITIVSSAKGKQGFVTAAEAEALTESRGAAPTHVLFDPQGIIGRAYEAKTTPHMFVIDEAQVLQFAGGIDDQPSANPATVETATNYVTAALGAMAAGVPVAVKTPRPYGCSVKYGR